MCEYSSNYNEFAGSINIGNDVDIYKKGPGNVCCYYEKYFNYYLESWYFANLPSIM